MELHSEKELQLLMDQHGLSEDELKEIVSRQAKIQLARQSMYDYTRYTFREYVGSRHLQLISLYLDRWIRGEIPRLMIFTPPRHGKSELVSRRLPGRIFGEIPKATIIGVSYRSALIEGMSRIARHIMQSKRYRDVYPNVRLSEKRSAVDEWEVEYWDEQEKCWELGGKYICAGVSGGITGEGYTHGIIDDPVKDRAQAESITYQNACFDWYTSTFYSRQAPNASILITMTRWSVNDLAGKLLDAMEESELADQWTVLRLPAIAEGDYSDPLAREDGEALWPERYPKRRLFTIKYNIGEYDFAALYQQDPMKAGKGRINTNNFRYVDSCPDSIPYVRFWDVATGTDKKSDFTASCLLGFDEESNSLYIKDITREQLDWPTTKVMMKSIAQVENLMVGIETGGAQKGFLDELEKDFSQDGLYILGVNPDRSKLVRALPWIARLNAGGVYLQRAQWNQDFIGECVRFSGINDKHDDQVDAVSGAYAMVREEFFGGPAIKTF